MNKLAIRPVDQAEVETMNEAARVAAQAPQGPAWSWLPDETPLAMPVQSLEAPTVVSQTTPATSPRAVALRRLTLLAGTIVLTALSAITPFYLYARKGWDGTEMVAFGLFMVLITAISCWFVSGLMGLVVMLRGKDQADLAFSPHPALPRTRTALLMPLYNEDARASFARLAQIDASLARLGAADAFDIFVLSDSTKEEAAAAELSVFQSFRQGAGCKAYYRRRLQNTERKVGNLSDWIRRFGGAYETMIVLDADSTMAGETLLRMVDAMERNPGVGLIQTAPVIIKARTIFARVSQYSVRLYGRVAAAGLAYWTGSESSYWGHNAIIRTAAFARHAGLPHLGGGKPFEGAVLSHDFVEAALLRRGGWAVHMAPGLGGSYEEGPPSLTDMLVRDRRWCQGNLQHGAVLPARGLHWISRLHLLVGIGHYFTAPMWAMLMLVGLAIPLQQAGFHLDQPQLAGFTPALYWRGGDPERFLWVFYFTMAVLLAPKVMGCIATMLDPALRRQCGGAARIAGSALLETAMAALMAPVTMYVQSRGVAEVLAGRDSGWETQRRDDGSVALAGLVRRYAGLTLFGLFCGVLAYLVSPALAAWMAPVILGMVLSVPINMVTASPRVGGRLCAAGWFRTPEDTTPPPVLARALELRSRNEGMPSIVEASGTTPSLRSYGPMVGAEDA